ncbi:MAG TPA: glycosyltransferase family 39 protein, partial [Thermoanaerobaculia bacterium]
MLSRRQTMWLLAAGAIALRVWLIFAHRIDSDEPQHLHIAWAWTRGLVQYRDVFDNHLPLLHLLFAPLMALMPESSSVFVLMRLAILPFAIGCSWLLFRFAQPFYGTRVAVVAALLFSVMPPWLSKSVEFRNDTVWILFWLAALALLARPKPAYFWSGVAFALCLLASIKAVPVLLAHLLALATANAIPRQRAIAIGALGFALPLVIALACFSAAGALDEMTYATLLFNAAAPIPEARRVGGAVAFVFVATGLVRVGKRGNELALFAAWYVSLLLAFWPILTSRDFLPLVPLGALAVARWVVGSRLSVRGHSSSRRSVTDNRQLTTDNNVTIAMALLVASLASLIEARAWRPSDPTRERFVDAA